MMSVRNAIISGVCALGVGLGAMPAEAASPSAPSTTASGQNTIAGIRMDQIQKVDRRGGWRSGGFGGRRGGWGGRSHYSGGGWGGRRYYGGGRRYYGRGGYGYGYAGIGVLGLATGALLANDYGYYDRPYYRSGYYDSGYYGRRYGGAECQVISNRRAANGRLYRVVRYRPC